mmetsp:Transcript_3947/g.5201  ORF Transcript_3947/g.5201 Transcript_3947/m.5201 type:complete len:185 (+) Transcript_3947:443-997(+)|eukprot:CAMPEP_0198143638 /NCGR_PEP_ID=MMETSP1443-20131203/8583_1 /TAXON_ID=186043 /ORGANISM="Entomoneis sp., Strain CCMP2396" /LENGTH=184 /DNA_ID=CAMNT_0043806903 /DNA_START=366 /DNA_END=920 /DNA_ORIENTATION=-
MPRNSQTDPLVQDPAAIPFYDPQAMLTMEKSLAQGYITLLTGGDPRGIENLRKNRMRRDAVDMGFLALLEGNVLETCFAVGTTPAGSKSRDAAVAAVPSLAKRTAVVRRVKSLLAEASDSTESICKMAVASYLRAFEIVVKVQEELDQLNFFTKCLFRGRIIRKAQADLEDTFARLQEAVQAST